MEAAIRLIASLAAPPRCCACAGRCSWREALCPTCDRGLRRALPRLEPGPGGVDSAWSAGAYEGTLRSVAVALKYSARLQVARRIAAAIAEGAPAALLTGALVPVPPAPRRLIRRGFDPAEEIAVELSELTGRRVVPCLERSDGPRQVGRPRSERLSDPPRVRAAFPPPSRCILVDDVHTTGATLSACAAALRRDGAQGVVAVTFARA